MKETLLHSAHKNLNAKMFDFFGWELPLEYSGLVDEHLAVRQSAGLFDVSHMGKIIISGSQALDFVQYLTPNNAASLVPNKAQYSALTTPEGTFIDDLLVYCLKENTYFLVVNAANVEKDYDWILGHSRNFEVKVENKSDDYTQMALQGPKAEEILTPLIDVKIQELKSFEAGRGRIAGEDVLVSRTGYTGENGFEVYTLSRNPEKIWDEILYQGKKHGLRPVGLGARDTLRLEAALLLYGNDISETTTVLEAGLEWLVKFKKGDFLGKETLLRQKENGIKRKIAGFEIIDRGIPRPHYPVLIGEDKVSSVTSGTFSPFFKKGIGMAYLPIEHTGPGSEIAIEIRGKQVKAKVVPLPFYERRA